MALRPRWPQVLPPGRGTSGDLRTTDGGSSWRPLFSKDGTLVKEPTYTPRCGSSSIQDLRGKLGLANRMRTQGSRRGAGALLVHPRVAFRRAVRLLTRSRYTILTCDGRAHRLHGCGSHWPLRCRWDWPS